VTYIAITPSAGITQPSTGGPPVAAGSTATLYQLAEGAWRSLGPVILYNISTAESVPGSVPATVVFTPGGHWVCQTWLGQVSPGAVIPEPGGIFQAPGF
jgi:hypothetical protein